MKPGVPEQYFETLKLFKKNSIDYVLIKQNKIVNKPVAGLDILFRNEKQYKKAYEFLIKDGFIVYWSEKNERYKTMLVKYENGFLKIIHIHRKLSWFGLKVLDTEPIFETAVKDGCTITPSDENVLLIHAAHVLFENFHLKDFELKLLKNLIRKKLDYDYINKQLSKNHWKKRFYIFIEAVKYILGMKKHDREFRKIFKDKKNLKFKKCFIAKTIFCKAFTNNISSNLWSIAGEAYNFIRRRISLKRKGTLIALLGMNGTGKSTLSSGIAERYRKLTEKLVLEQERYYFGWKPFLFTTKLMSKNLKKKGKKVYDLAEKKPKGFDLFQELMFLYVFIEYLFRYLFHVYPKLKNRYLVVSDRYFYYLYGQYPYAEKSKLLKLLIKVFPRPDFTFVLDAGINTVMKRDKALVEGNKLLEGKRNVAALENLRAQKLRHLKLRDILGAELIDTERLIQENINFIIEKTWKKMIKRLSY